MQFTKKRSDLVFFFDTVIWSIAIAFYEMDFTLNSLLLNSHTGISTNSQNLLLQYSQTQQN